MKRKTIVIILGCLIIAARAGAEIDKDIQYLPAGGARFQGLNTDDDKALIGPFELSDCENVIVNADGSIEKRKGKILRKTFDADSIDTFSYDTYPDWVSGETKNVDYTISPGTISLSSTSTYWTQGSVADFDSADSLVNIDSTTYAGMLTVNNPDVAKGFSSWVTTSTTDFLTGETFTNIDTTTSGQIAYGGSFGFRDGWTYTNPTILFNYDGKYGAYSGKISPTVIINIKSETNSILMSKTLSYSSSKWVKNEININTFSAQSIKIEIKSTLMTSDYLTSPLFISNYDTLSIYLYDQATLVSFDAFRPETATYVSKVLDAGIASVPLGIPTITFDALGGTVVFNIRSADTEAEIVNSVWTRIYDGLTPDSATHCRYLQWEVCASSDLTATLPIIYDVTIKYGSGTTATASDSVSASYYPENAIDRDTGTGASIYSDFEDISGWVQVLGAFETSTTKIYEGMYSGTFSSLSVGQGAIENTVAGAVGSTHFSWWVWIKDDASVAIIYFPLALGGSKNYGFYLQKGAWGDARFYNGLSNGFSINYAAWNRLELRNCDWTPASPNADLYVNNVFITNLTLNAGFYDPTRMFVDVYQLGDYFDYFTYGDATLTEWASDYNTAYLEIELADTITIGSAGFYQSTLSGTKAFDIQFWDGDAGAWDTAVEVTVDGASDTNLYCETFTAFSSKYVRLQFLAGTETPVYVREFYVMPMATYISQLNTDSNIMSGMMRDFDVTDTVTSSFAEYHIRTDDIVEDTETWVFADKNTDLMREIKPQYQVKVEMYPYLTALNTIDNPVFETFTLNYQYRTTTSGQWVSPKIDRGSKYVMGRIILTGSDSQTTGTSTVYYVRHATSEAGVDSASWAYCASGGGEYTTDRYAQVRADLTAGTVTTTPYVYSIDLTSYDSSISGPIFGLYEFKKSNGKTYLMAVTDSCVYYSEDGTNFTLLASGFTSNLEMCFVTITDTNGNETCVMSNGTDNRRDWDETALTEHDGSEQVSPVVMAFMQGYLFGADHSNPGRLYHSEQWNGVDLGETNYILVPIPAGEYIVALAPISRLADDISSYLMIQSQTTTWLLKSVASGISAGNLMPVFTELGGRSHYANTNIEKTLFFPANRGIFSFDGANLNNIGAKIQPTYDALGQIFTGQAFWLTTTQDDWQAGETKTNTDTGSYYVPAGSIGISRTDTYIINFSFEQDLNINWSNRSSAWSQVTGVVHRDTYSAFNSSGGVDYVNLRVYNSSGSQIYDFIRTATTAAWQYSNYGMAAYKNMLIRVGVICTKADGTVQSYIISDNFVCNGSDVRYWFKTTASGQPYIDDFETTFTYRVAKDSATYVSAVYNTGIDSPFYGIFEADYSANGQTVSFYIRSGRTAAACEADTWYSAANDNYTAGLENYRFVQYEINMSAGNTTTTPQANSVKINWGTSQATNEASMQGIWWDDWYLLAAAEAGSTYNNVVYAYNFKSGQCVKFTNWYVNRWCRFNDELYFGDSRNGKIYRAWVGYNDAGESITAFAKLKTSNFGAPYEKKNMRFLYVTVKTNADTSSICVYYTADDSALISYDTIPLYSANRTRRIQRLEINKDFYFFEVEFFHDALDKTFKIYDYQYGITAGRMLKDEW